MLVDRYEAAGKLPELFAVVADASDEPRQYPELIVPKNGPEEPELLPEEEDDMMAIPDVAGLTIRPLAPKRKRPDR